MNVILNVGAEPEFGINWPAGGNWRHLLALSDQTGQGELERERERERWPEYWYPDITDVGRWKWKTRRTRGPPGGPGRPTTSPVFACDDDGGADCRVAGQAVLGPRHRIPALAGSQLPAWPGLGWTGVVIRSLHSTRGETESLRDKRELTLSPPALPAGSDWGVWPGLVSIKVVVEERRGEGRVAPSSLQSQRAPDWLSLVRRKTLTEKIKLRI